MYTAKNYNSLFFKHGNRVQLVRKWFQLFHFSIVHNQWLPGVESFGVTKRLILFVYLSFWGPGLYSMCVYH